MRSLSMIWEMLCDITTTVLSRLIASMLALICSVANCVDCPVEYDSIDLSHEGTDKGKDEGDEYQPTVWIYVRLDSFEKFDQIHSKK